MFCIFCKCFFFMFSGLFFATLGFFLSMAVLGVFIFYRDTPVVKSSNRKLSFLLLLVITSSFGLPFLYTGEPKNWSCAVQPVYFGIVYTVCTSILLAKTYQYICIFNGNIRSNQRSPIKTFNYDKQKVLITCLTGVEIAILAIFLAFEQPSVQKHTDIPDGIQVYCGDDWMYMQIASMCYISLLSLICTVLAFKARKLPENFNETKHISLTMLSLNLVWIASYTAYFGVTSKTRNSVVSLCVDAASIFILGCMFFPRIYIIFFDSQKNTPGFMQTVTMRHSMAITMRQLSQVIKKYSETCQNQTLRKPGYCSY